MATKVHEIRIRITESDELSEVSTPSAVARWLLNMTTPNQFATVMVREITTTVNAKEVEYKLFPLSGPGSRVG